MTFSSSSDEFAVVCAGLSLHFAERHSNNTVSLENWSGQCSNSEHSGVLLEVSSGQQHIEAVSYIDGETMEVCSVNSGTRSNPGLPQNIDCLATSNPTVHPIHTPDMFMLQCTTEDGPTLYVLSVPRDVETSDDARTIPARVRPYSSPDGAYIAVVDSKTVILYVTEDSSAGGNAKEFTGQITSLEFLDNKTLLIVTDTDHIVINVTASQFREFKDGVPVAHVWIEGHYIYAVKSGEFYKINIVNGTATEPMLEIENIVKEPEMLLFLMKRTEPTKSRGLSTEDNTNTPIIIGTVIGALIVVVFGGFLLALLIIRRKKIPYTRLLCPNPSSGVIHAQPQSDLDSKMVHLPDKPNVPYHGQIPARGGDEPPQPPAQPVAPESKTDNTDINREVDPHIPSLSHQPVVPPPVKTVPLNTPDSKAKTTVQPNLTDGDPPTTNVSGAGSVPSQSGTVPSQYGTLPTQSGTVPPQSGTGASVTGPGIEPEDYTRPLTTRPDPFPANQSYVRDTSTASSAFMTAVEQDGQPDHIDFHKNNVVP